MTDLQIGTSAKWALTGILIAIGCAGIFLRHDSVGHLRGPCAVWLGLACIAYTAGQILRPLFWPSNVTPTAATPIQEGGKLFVVVVLNLFWFLVSTVTGGVGEGQSFWKNPVVDLNNAVQIALLLIALSLLIRNSGIPRVDTHLRVWVIAFCLVVAANYLALFDSHWHHLPGNVTGHDPIPDRLWIQWWLTNICTLVLYAACAILVLHRVPMTRACAGGALVTIISGWCLWKIYGVI